MNNSAERHLQTVEQVLHDLSVKIQAAEWTLKNIRLMAWPSILLCLLLASGLWHFSNYSVLVGIYALNLGLIFPYLIKITMDRIVQKTEKKLANMKEGVRIYEEKKKRFQKALHH
ncbi:hypothetical protein [Persicobacter diffluens]|uniref:Uncharacterized protein n=1 Tax=Persicobacter diffluens TaxID=981 RepID=A0AAN5AM13_9BACT|nr:hypothetical protein PEDI_44610 [Persicobacter diffluens]